MNDQAPKKSDSVIKEPLRKHGDEADRVLPSGREDGGMGRVNRDAREIDDDENADPRPQKNEKAP